MRARRTTLDRSAVRPATGELQPQSVLADLRLIPRSLAALFLVGPAFALIWLAVSPYPSANETGLVAVAGLGLAVGALLLARGGERSPLGTLRMAVPASILLISLTIYFSGTANSGFGLFYLWAMPYTFCFLTRRQTVGHMLLLGVSCAAALGLQPGSISLGELSVRWSGLVASVLVVGILMRRLTLSLRESDVRFERGFSAARVGMALIGTDGSWLRVNPALCRLLDRPQGEVIGRSVDEHRLPADGPSAVEVLRAVADDGERPVVLEQAYVRPNGRVVWTAISASLIRDSGRAPAYFYAQVHDITERKLARELRAEHERQLAEAQRIAQLGGWEWDVVRDRITWSDELYRIYGRQPGDLDAGLEAYLEMVHPDDREGLQLVINRAVRTGEPFNSYHRARRGDGVVLVIHSRGETVTDAQGRTLRMFGTAQDVSERMAAEERLARSEKRLAEAQRVARLGSWEWDRDTDAVTGSAEMLRILGLEPTAGAGLRKAVSDWIHPEDRDRVNQVILEASRAGRPFSCEFRVIRRDGAVRVVHARGEPKLDRDGNLAGMIGTDQDITELRAAMDAVRRADKRFRDLVDNAPDAILMVDGEGRMVLVNAQTEKLTGYSSAELLGQFSTMIAPQPVREEYVRRHLRFFAGKELAPSERDFVIERKDGTQFPCEVAFTRLEGEEGGLVVASIRDTTERKQAQETEAALRARLHQSERLESVGLLAGGIAHDFNNLLAVVLNYSSLLESQLVEDAQVMEDLGEIRRAAQRAAELTHQLLVFSQRDAAELRPIDLGVVVGETERLLARTIGEEVVLETRHQDGLLAVLANAAQIEQVLVNLAINARDAMPGGGRLTIETSNVEVVPDSLAGSLDMPPGRYVRMTVSDTGMGMTDDVAARAFDPFFTTKPRGKGTGLGLASAYGIVTQAGGHVELGSPDGQGTTVIIHLPATEHAAVASEGRPLVGEGVPAGHGETILVVEDEGAVRDLTRRILLQHGYGVLSAESPADALRTCARPESPIDLLLTDVVMPEMPGTELAQRAGALRPGLRVLFMSGYIPQASGNGNGEAFLAKPFTADGLLRAVHESLAPA